MIQCPHDGCGNYVVYDDKFHHQIGCPHASWTCPEPGCAFAQSPVGLVCHLLAAHSIPIHEFWYGVPTLFLLPVPVPGSPHLQRLCYGEDGSVFVLTIGALGPVTVVSFMCVRSGAWLWPQYMVTMWAKGPAAPPGSSMAEYPRDEVKVVFEAKSSTSLGAVALEELTSSFLLLLPQYLIVGAAPHKEVAFSVCIAKKNKS